MQPPRLYCSGPLANGATIRLDPDQSHYLLHVLRCHIGSAAIVFDGINGEWKALVTQVTRHACTLTIEQYYRPQDHNPPIGVAFALPKGRRLGDLIEKLTELGTGTLQPMLTARTVARAVPPHRLHAHITAAAMQCGFNSLPRLEPIATLPDLLQRWRHHHRLLFCDETTAATPATTPADLIAMLATTADSPVPAILLIGPEGGFTPEERDLIATHQPPPLRLRLGPRILRIDTAAIAALALWQAVCGDWR